MHKLALMGLIIIFCFKSIAMDNLVEQRQKRFEKAKKNDRGHCQIFKKEPTKNFIRNLKLGIVKPEDAYAKALSWSQSNDPIERRYATVVFGELVKNTAYTDAVLIFANQALNDGNIGVRNAALEIYIPLVEKNEYTKEAQGALELFYNNLTNFHPYSVDSFWRLNKRLIGKGIISPIANKVAFLCMNSNPTGQLPANDTICPRPLYFAAYNNWIGALEFYAAAVAAEKNEYIPFAHRALDLSACLSEYDIHPTIKPAVTKLAAVLKIDIGPNSNYCRGEASQSLAQELIELRSILADRWLLNQKLRHGTDMDSILTRFFMCEKKISADNLLKNDPILISLIFLNYVELLRHNLKFPKSIEFARNHINNNDNWVKLAFEIFVKENVRYRKFLNIRQDLLRQNIY